MCHLAGMCNTARSGKLLLLCPIRMRPGVSIDGVDGGRPHARLELHIEPCRGFFSHFCFSAVAWNARVGIFPAVRACLLVSSLCTVGTSTMPLAPSARAAQ